MHFVNLMMTTFTAMNVAAVSMGSLKSRRSVNAWSPWQSLNGGATDSVAAASASDGIRVFVRGTADGGLYTTASSNGSAWGRWEQLGALIFSQPNVVSWGPGRLDVFALGSSSSLWHIASNNGTWSAWENLNNGNNSPTLVSAATAVSRGLNLLDVFAVGIDSACWHLAYNGTAWGSWETLGVAIVTQPTVVVGPNHLDVFALGTDHAIWHMAWS